MICCLNNETFWGRAFSGVGGILDLLVIVLDLVCLDVDSLVGVDAGLLGWDALLCLFFPWEEDDILNKLSFSIMECKITLLLMFLESLVNLVV